MWSISKILFFTTVLKSIISGIIPTISVYLSKLFVEQLTAKNFRLTIIYILIKYSLQGTTQGRYLTGGVPPVRFSM